MGTLEELHAFAGGKRYRAIIGGVTSGVASLVATIDGVSGVTLEDETDDKITLSIKGANDPRPELYNMCVSQHWSLCSLEVVIPSLEEAFLNIVSAEE